VGNSGNSKGTQWSISAWKYSISCMSVESLLEHELADDERGCDSGGEGVAAAADGHRAKVDGQQVEGRLGPNSLQSKKLKALALPFTQGGA
jgi:hypothetical protein